MKRKIIFGIESYQNQGFNINKIYLGYKDTWETTKDAYDSQIFLDQDLGWDEDEELQAEIPLDDIEIPGGSIWDYITLGYEVMSEDPINTQEIKETFEDHGFEYCPEFEESIIKVMREEVETKETMVEENLKEYYTKAVKIAKNWLEEKRKKEGTTYSYNQPISNPEKRWESMTAEEKEHYGEKPDFEVYYYDENIYLVVDGWADCDVDMFCPEFQKSLLEELISEYE